jgi:hypothetical protein
MAHFARIDSDNKVQEVIVVSNDVLNDDDGVEQESLGQAFIASLGLAGTWLQCSYHGTMRGAYPGLGWVYDSGLDEFVAPEPVEVTDEAV